jgi:CBS domain-containing protein
MKKCSEVMTKNPVCCLPNDLVAKVAQLMKSKDIGPVPIIENEQTKKLVGIVTDRDLALKIVAEGRDAKSTKAEEVMTRKVVTCRGEDDVQKALDAMSEHQLRRIPVVDNDNRIVGIIAQADVATRVDQPAKTAEVVKDISGKKGGFLPL